MYKKYFCTFADSRMSESLNRIKNQAISMKYFDEIFINDENNLDIDFLKEFKDRLVKGSRGYGYWVWKPQIILQTMRKMGDNDILLYSDVGCHLNKAGVNRLNEYFEIVKSNNFGMLVFQEAVKSENPNLTVCFSHLDKLYSKGDIFKHFDAINRPDIYNTGMIAATTFVIRKNKDTIRLIEEWLRVFQENFNLVDDSPSKTPNLAGFIENRHDQSIFSILCKINGVQSVSAYEIWQDDWDKLNLYPIWAKRDKNLKLPWLLRQKSLSLIRILRNNFTNMNIARKIKKFLSMDNREKIESLKRLVDRFVLYTLPFFRIFTLPFASRKNRRNLYLDLLERVTDKGPFIRYRNYLGFKLFYSCSKQGTGIVNHVMMNRIYEKDTCKILEKSLEKIKNPVFIDVGANIGLISLYVLNKFPSSKIFAFEPSPHQHELFEKTIESNNIEDRLKLYNFALSNKEGELSFFVHNEANCSGDGLIDTGRGGSGKNIRVQTTPLDIWWNQNDRPSIDLIKIDTEGAELLVLEGSKEILSKCSPDIFFEMQKNNYRVYNYTWIDIYNLLTSFGYSIKTEHGEKFTLETAEILMKKNYNFIAQKNEKSTR